MTTHKLTYLLQALRSPQIDGGEPRDVEIAAITADSRQCGPGTLFVAVRGTRVDGHSFIGAVATAGAAAVVCEEIPADAPSGPIYIKVSDTAEALGLLASQWHGNPSRHLRLVGVTGTNGKTTIATLLYEMARMQGHKAGLLSTVVNKIDTREVPATHTTPDPLELQALLARMVDEGCTFCAMEVSSHAAAQHRIAGLEFAGGVFTNLTRDHLDYHKTFANYLRAKQSFFDGLGSDSFALTNLDDRNGEVMLQNTCAHRYSYSIRGNADFRGKVIEDRLDGMLMSFNGVEVETLFAGRFNASNLTAVYGASLLLGWDKEAVLRGMSLLIPVAGRFQTVHGPEGITAIVDYAHTPDALVNVLDTINEITAGKRGVITVCGCGGERDRGKRPIMAAEAAARSMRVILTSDNPRSENPAEIIEEMRAGLDAEAVRRTLSVTDRREAIRTAVALASPGDVVLLAGKGHEDYQVLAHGTVHFSDIEEVKNAFAERQPK